MSSRGVLQLHTTFLDLLLESANIVNDSHEAEMSNFKKSCQKSSCQRCKGILTEYACGLEGLCMGKWWWSFVSHKWVILKNENGTLHVAGSQLDTINPRKYKAHGGGGGFEVDALSPNLSLIHQRKFQKEDFRNNTESFFSCSFILYRIFD